MSKMPIELLLADANRGCRMLLAGVGGGGCNAVARMAAGWEQGPELLLVNTDVKSLKTYPGVPALHIGKHLTHGLGAGGDPAVGRLSAEEDLDALRAAVSGRQLVGIVTTLGGGTGSGAAPILARVAREEGALTLVFATTPFLFEGERRTAQAEEALRQLRNNANAVILLPNQRLLDILPDQTSLADAFSAVDRMIGVGMHHLWILLSRNNMINLDFADLQSLVEHSGGACEYGYGEGRGAKRADEALQDILAGPMLEQGHAIGHAGALLISIVGGPDLQLAEIQKITRQIGALARPGTHLTLGAATVEQWADRLAITVLVARTWREPAKSAAAETSAGATSAGISAASTTADDQLPALAESPADGTTVVRPIRSGVQGSLQFETQEKGRFREVDPTLVDGQDLDVPTFVRRGIKINIDRA